MNKKINYDLQKRLISFSISIIEIVENLPKTYTGNHFAKQLVRSGTSPAFQYGEAQSAESRRDFIHKMKIGLKELRESFICLTIIYEKPLYRNEKVPEALSKCDELIAIFVSSIKTAKLNDR